MKQYFRQKTFRQNSIFLGMPKSRTRRASIISDDEFSEQAIQVIKKIKRGNVEVSRIKADTYKWTIKGRF